MPKMTSVRMDWLRSFATVAEASSYEAAARRLGLAQPTVWKHVHSLSHELGVELFSSGSVQLTATGTQLVVLARRMLELQEDFLRSSEDLRNGVTGVVRVACYPAHVKHFLAEVSGRYKHKYPGSRIELAPVDQSGSAGRALLEQLAQGEVDLAVGPKRVEFNGQKIYEARLVVVLPDDHPYRFSPEHGVELLRNEPLLLSPKGYFSRSEVERACLAAGFEPRIEAESASWMALLALGHHRVGVPVVPDDTLDESSTARAPYPALTDEIGRQITKETWLQWRKNEQLQPAVSNFISFVREFVTLRNSRSSLDARRSH